MQRKIMLGVVGILAVVTVVWAAAFARPYVLHGSEISTQVIAPALNLERPDGSTFNLHALKGKIALIFFGYTACPDICPTTMADFSRVKADLGELADQVEFVFVTVDPQRDTPERTQQYAAGFDASFIGLSGTESQLQPVWDGYGVYRKLEGAGHHNGYSVDHSTRIYLIDKSNHLRLTYAYGTAVEDISNDIRFLLKEK
jgi:protein SCO1/2